MKPFLRLLSSVCLLLFVAFNAQSEETVDPPSANTVSGAEKAASPSVKSATAAKPVASSVPQVGESVTDINPVTVVLGLGFILLLIFASAWLMKRVGGISVGGVAGMKIVSGLSVGPREKILLIQVGDRQELVGVAPGRVSHLQSYETPVIASAGVPAGEFSRRFRSLIHPDTDKEGEVTR